MLLSLYYHFYHCYEALGSTYGSNTCQIYSSRVLFENKQTLLWSLAIIFN